MSDVVVIGAGPNGLVAANLLADAGLDVVVYEEQPEPGGAVRSGQLTVPGYEHDLFSAFYPFAVASPAMQRLELERWGVRWRHAPLVLAHPTPDGCAVALSRDLDETADSLEAFGAGDGEAWRRLYRLWTRIEEPFMHAFTTPFPPLRAGVRLAGALRVRGALELARLAVLPLRRLAEEAFRGEGAALLLAGNALHADLTPESPGSAAFGFILSGLGQSVGFPVPEGGAGRLTDALVRRLRSAGGEVVCGARAEQVIVRGGRAVGVRLAGGERAPARVGVLADVGAPQLYRELLARDAVPARIHRGLRRFQYDYSTIKVDWALSAPVPWTAPAVRRAGTVHVGESLDFLSQTTGEIERGLIPGRPFLVFGQYAAADPTRAPAGAEVAWAYTHVPQVTLGDARGELRGVWDAGELAVYAARMEDEVERFAPGFKRLIVARHVFGPHELERQNRNLVGGALNGGTAKLHQQLVFRPLPGLARPETPIAGLLLASASAHPGGGVHGAPGAIAARALLRRMALTRRVAEKRQHA
jgi:phytoene dehydrogenase-like protein